MKQNWVTWVVNDQIDLNFGFASVPGRYPARFRFTFIIKCALDKVSSFQVYLVGWFTGFEIFSSEYPSSSLELGTNIKHNSWLL